MPRHAPHIGAVASLAAGLCLLCQPTCACQQAGAPCAESSDCPSAQVCAEGYCRDTCNSAADCTGDQVCFEGACLPERVAHRPDAAASDAATPDAPTPDAPTPDALTPDAPTTDSSWLDRAAADSNAPDLAPTVTDGGGRPDAPVITSDGTMPDLPVEPADAAVADSSVPPQVCGTVAALRDDFGDGTLAPWYQFSNGANLTETAGALVMSLPAGGNRSAGVISDFAADLDGSAVQVEVDVLSSTADSDTYFGFVVDDENSLFFVVTDGELYLVVEEGGTSSAVSPAYDPYLHRLWRLREQDGVIDYEASPDGASFDTLHSIATPAFLTAGVIELSIWSYDRTEDMEVRFDNLNIGTPAVPWCPSSSVQDAFDGAISPDWSISGYAGCPAPVEVLGTLQLQAGRTTPSCSVWHRSGFELDSFSAELVDVPTRVDSSAYLVVSDLRGYHLEFGVGEDELYYWSPGLPAVQPVLVAGRYQLRISNRDSVLLLQASNGVDAWETIFTIAAPPASSPFKIGLGVDCDSCSDHAVTASFDNVNLL